MSLSRRHAPCGVGIRPHGQPGRIRNIAAEYRQGQARPPCSFHRGVQCCRHVRLPYERRCRGPTVQQGRDGHHKEFLYAESGCERSRKPDGEHYSHPGRGVYTSHPDADGRDQVRVSHQSRGRARDRVATHGARDRYRARRQEDPSSELAASPRGVRGIPPAGPASVRSESHSAGSCRTTRTRGALAVTPGPSVDRTGV